LHTGLNLPPKDNLRKEDKSSAPKVSFIWRFHCNFLPSLATIIHQYVCLTPMMKKLLLNFTGMHGVPYSLGNNVSGCRIPCCMGGVPISLRGYQYP